MEVEKKISKNTPEVFFGDTLAETNSWNQNVSTETRLKEVEDTLVLWERKKCKVMCVLIAWFKTVFSFLWLLIAVYC